MLNYTICKVTPCGSWSLANINHQLLSDHSSMSYSLVPRCWNALQYCTFYFSGCHRSHYLNSLFFTLLRLFLCTLLSIALVNLPTALTKSVSGLMQAVFLFVLHTFTFSWRFLMHSIACSICFSKDAIL